MTNNRNDLKRSIHLRDMNDCCMNDCGMKMDLNEFVGMSPCCDGDIDNKPIAMAYVPWQKWRMLYEPKEALKRGTLFKELDLPFEAAKECK